MIEYRSFLNCDPPAIAQIWQSQQPHRGLARQVTPATLEQIVFSKPYFDPAGLVLALDDQRPVGFVHAGFGPAADYSRLETDEGVTCMLMVVPCENRLEIAAELLRRSEQYLTSRGARRLYGCGAFAFGPFYLGLYGGSQLSGILASDQLLLDVFGRLGYQAASESVVLQRRLADFHPLRDRQQVLARRRFRLRSVSDPPACNWWEACTIGQTNRIRYLLCERNSGRSCGVVTFWDMEPLASGWQHYTMGLVELELDPALRGQGLGAHLVGQALCALADQGVERVEVHVPRDQPLVLRVFERLAFQQVDRAVVMCKAADREDR